MSELLVFEQSTGAPAVQPWVLDGSGRRMDAQDHDRRLAELLGGLQRHPRVRTTASAVATEQVEHALGELHAPEYLWALQRLDSAQPTLMPEFAAPGMAPDTPVCAPVAAAAYEAVRTTIAAASSVAAGAPFAYALCGPPGHHAGPAWLGGCCYLNNAAAAALTLREEGAPAVGILDLDIHYPNGTAAIAASMSEVRLHSLHAWPVVNVPTASAQPCCERERVVEFSEPPGEDPYLQALADSLGSLSESVSALVVSLGYDTIDGDPHGCWGFSPEIFASIGRLLAGAGLPVCVVQEGGYALDALADCAYAFAGGLLDEVSP